MALKRRGVEPGFQEYYRAWVLGILGFLKPRELEAADDMRGF
jgi:hypothetical protein